MTPEAPGATFVAPVDEPPNRAVDHDAGNPELPGAERHLVAPEGASDEGAAVDHDHVTGCSLLESALHGRMLARRRAHRERRSDDTGAAPHGADPCVHRDVASGQVADVGCRERRFLHHALILTSSTTPVVV